MILFLVFSFSLLFHNISLCSVEFIFSLYFYIMLVRELV